MRSTGGPALQPLLRRALTGSKILSAARERELLMRYHTNEDKAAMDELVRSHMPIIFRVAGRSARNPGVDINDLVQTATEGLLIAINRWSFEKSDASAKPREIESEADIERASAESDIPDHQRDTTQTDADPEAPRFSRLATYAMWWMRILLTDSVIGSRGVIVRAKNPKVRKALFGLPMAIKALDIRLPLAGSDVTRISAYLGIGEREIEEALIHAAGDVMLDEPVGDGSMLRGEVLPDVRAEGEEGILSRLASEDRWNAICEALMELPPRDRFILITRYYMTPKWKLDRLADTLTLSRERIRQIGADSLTRIRRLIETSAPTERRGSRNRRDADNDSVPMLRSVTDLDRGGASGGVRKAAPRRTAAAEVEALSTAIERAAASANPNAITTFLAEHQVVLGPTRIVNSLPSPVDANFVVAGRDNRPLALTFTPSDRVTIEPGLALENTRQAERLSSIRGRTLSEARVA